MVRLGWDAGCALRKIRYEEALSANTTDYATPQRILVRVGREVRGIRERVAC